jgi:hypothetical protein
MKIHRRYAMLIPTMAVVLCLATPPANAGGSFGIHLGNGGFGVSVGFGDWGVYTRSWSDPYWSLDFNSALAGYGEWVWVNGLGRVWRPWVSVGWRPYTYGRWVATGVNWTWVAYEPWGYIPHHYGSWAYCSFGWVWQPGYSYYHANVVWTRSGSYVGWYARPPHGWSHAAHGFRHGYRHGYRDGYSDGWHDARYGNYVDWRHFGSENVSHHTVTHTMATRDRFEDNATQPSAAEVRRRGGVTIAQTQLSRRTVRLGDREVTIARPEGVAASIERNAADAVAGALAPVALERRQPLVRSRSSSPTRASTTRGPSAHETQAKPLEVRNTPRGPSSSRSGTPAMASGSRTRNQSVASAARPSSARPSSLGMRPSPGGQVVREVRVNRPMSNSRTNAARPSQRSERTVSAAGSAETRQSAEKPGATSAVRRTPHKPRAEATTRERKAQNANKDLRRRSSGSSQR